jgi:hypothetical protein
MMQTKPVSPMVRPTTFMKDELLFFINCLAAIVIPWRKIIRQRVGLVTTLQIMSHYRDAPKKGIKTKGLSVCGIMRSAADGNQEPEARSQ